MRYSYCTGSLQGCSWVRKKDMTAVAQHLSELTGNKTSSLRPMLSKKLGEVRGTSAVVRLVGKSSNFEARWYGA